MILTKLCGVILTFGLLPATLLATSSPEAFRGNKVQKDAHLKAKASKVPSYLKVLLQESSTYHGEGVLIEEENETEYSLSIVFHDDGLIETTMSDPEGEETFAYQWVFADEESGEFSVVIFDEEGNPETVGEGLCTEESCHMMIGAEEGYLEESFYFEEDHLYKEGYGVMGDDEAVWEEYLTKEGSGENSGAKTASKGKKRA